MMKVSHWYLLTAVALFAGVPSASFAQTTTAAAEQPAAEQPAAATQFSAEELRDLLKPIALFPDVLLAQVLPASAYPLDIVQAARWLDRNKAAVAKGDYSVADGLDWDASVKSLLRFPDIIKRMNEDLDWTTDLGDAFVNQPKDVADTIQALRAEAEQKGVLQSNKQQKVVRRDEGAAQVIVIEPTEPETVYIPIYDPVPIYDTYNSGVVAAGLIGFGTGVIVGSIWNDNYWNWGSGWVYPPVWPGYPNWRPGYPGRPGIDIGGDVNIGGGNNINIGNGNIIGNTKPWRPDGDRYRPGQGSKPGLANVNRPGIGNNRPGVNRPTTLPGNVNVGEINIGNKTDISNKLGNKANIGNKADIGNKIGNKADIGNKVGNKADIGNKIGNKADISNKIGNKAGNRPNIDRPATRPATRDTAFSGIDRGRANDVLSNRGASSRMNMDRRPPAGNFNRGGGGGGANFNRGGGGGAKMSRGGGGGGGGRIARGR